MRPNVSDPQGRWLWTGCRTARCDSPGCGRSGRQWLYEIAGARLRVSACRACEAALKAPQPPALDREGTAAARLLAPNAGASGG
jgi:hypothetical protein